MPPKNHTDQRTFRLIYLCIVLFFIAFNFISRLPYYNFSLHIIKAHQVPSIGQEYIPLYPYLKKVQWAGYMTCQDSSHPLTDTAIMGGYQQAQFVLSPTILNYLHPYDHRYIVLQCPDDVKVSRIRKRLSADIILKTKDGILLLYRRKRSS